MRNNKGITLIALVITIIVLLVLAGVSIAMVTGQNGILNQASRAGAQTQVAEAKEMAGMDLSAKVAEFYEAKYVNNTIARNTTVQSYVTNATTGLTNTTDYTISGNIITIVPKTENGNTVTGNIQVDGSITWSE